MDRHGTSGNSDSPVELGTDLHGGKVCRVICLPIQGVLQSDAGRLPLTYNFKHHCGRSYEPLGKVIAEDKAVPEELGHLIQRLSAYLYANNILIA